jgi:hypothetical protein
MSDAVDELVHKHARQTGSRKHTGLADTTGAHHDDLVLGHVDVWISSGERKRENKKKEIGIQNKIKNKNRERERERDRDENEKETQMDGCSNRALEFGPATKKPKRPWKLQTRTRVKKMNSIQHQSVDSGQ